MQQKVLITGGSGLLALNWALSIRDKYAATLALHQRKISLQGVDAEVIALGSIEECLAALDKYQPDTVIHTAGLTDVEKCEENPKLAQEINAGLSTNIAIACNEKNIKLVHISTDHLFSGELALATEESTPNPINNYAKTKLEGERQVQKYCKNALVIRTNFFGWGTKYRSSFSDFILSNLRKGKSINLFKDVFFTPILIDELVDKVHQLLDINAAGVFNIVGNERLSKYEFGIRLANFFDLDVSLINIANISDKVELIKRPKDMSLSNAKLYQTLNCQILSIDKQFQSLKNQENDYVLKQVVIR